jgi:ATP-binding cassette subfamily F protein 3
MLSVHQISKSYGDTTVLQNISFNLSQGERVALIGPNGCGKTTLLRILLGQEKPDRGKVARHESSLRVGYLAQGTEIPAETTLAQAVAQTRGFASALEDDLPRLALALAAAPQRRDLQTAYDLALQEVAALALNPEPGPILAALGLDALSPDQPIGLLSGGQKTRLGLALVLLSEPHLLLLDEPTNHLDLAMLEWLEDWLASFRGAALIVSHDRTFLDHTVSSILELDPASHQLHAYTGNYSAYLEQKQAEVERQWQTYHDQQAEIKRMSQDIARVKAQAAETERAASSIRIGGPEYKAKGFKSYQQGIAKKVAAKAKAREKKLERFLDSEAIVERPKASWSMKLEFHTPEHRSRDVLALENLSIGYSPDKPLLQGISLTLQGGERVALTGPNGCGKTTLLRTIAGQIEPLGGALRLGGSIRLGYMTQEQESLNPLSTPLDEILHTAAVNQTQARSFLHRFLFSGDASLRPIHRLSFGERARLALALLVAQGSNFLLLDEPINHLDIASRTSFEQALASFDGTVLAVVHDRYFIEHFATRILAVQDGRMDAL